VKISSVKWIKQNGNHYKKITINFLGNHRAENCRDMMADLARPYKAVGCNMSLRVNLLYPYLEFFAENLGELSDEHGFGIH
jgi:hypothetical protein